jgi:transcription-repair coupling factor (superfamily II helicase)
MSVTGDLTPGDYVVHLDHGIGVYRGLTTIDVGDGGSIEGAVVEYEGGDKLNVPLYGLDQLERYRAAGDGDSPPPRLHRLGGGSWKKVREKTRDAIKNMAAELLDLYARRKVAAGYAFPPDTRWQRELESSFLYEDTPDQRRATEEVKRDLERPVPMDRLLVGDVGYGKTEVAVRAAFKALQGGKQAAVLVPTTILAEQHGRTFTERLADFPVKVEVLSRFRTAKEQKAVLEQLADGKIDIVIGTHRLLSRDVTFKDLGLLIVDEEHRFGVKHKERLKALRLVVDVLTLTATPIPRTLHLSLAGLRDLSLIETPPRDRSPILTFVEPWDDALLEEAFARELDRGGQVFVVHNRIETIDTVASRVSRLASRARVAVAHGQMPSDDLEEVMRRLGVERSRLKEIMGAVAERVARLKANGRLVRPSPLSVVVELEALSAGVFAKQSLWRSLRAAGLPELDREELTRLAERAAAQLEVLREHKDRAAAEVFAHAPTPAA